MIYPVSFFRFLVSAPAIFIIIFNFLNLYIFLQHFCTFYKNVSKAKKEVKNKKITEIRTYIKEDKEERLKKEFKEDRLTKSINTNSQKLWTFRIWKLICFTKAQVFFHSVPKSVKSWYSEVAHFRKTLKLNCRNS